MVDVDGVAVDVLVDVDDVELLEDVEDVVGAFVVVVVVLDVDVVLVDVVVLLVDVEVVDVEDDEEVVGAFVVVVVEVDVVVVDVVAVAGCAGEGGAGLLPQRSAAAALAERLGVLLLLLDRVGQLQAAGDALAVQLRALLRDYPIEIAETASMSMELLGLEQLAEVYAPDDVRRVRQKHLEGVLRTLTWIASIDAFQHWVYANPKHDREARRTAWIDIRRRFGSDVDWSGLDDALAMQWIGQGHLFQHAFYYVEYAIAQLAALQVWARYRREPARALADYEKGLALGGSRPLPELFAAMGVRFDLGSAVLQPLVDDVLREIG